MSIIHTKIFNHTYGTWGLVCNFIPIPRIFDLQTYLFVPQNVVRSQKAAMNISQYLSSFSSNNTSHNLSFIKLRVGSLFKLTQFEFPSKFEYFS